MSIHETIVSEKTSHRTHPEQWVGLGIYLSLSFAFALLSGLAVKPLAGVYALFLALGMWALWRRYSLRVLKLELSLFLAQLLFQLGWRIDAPLLVLVSLLLLSFTTLMTALLFWKKNRVAGALYAFPLLWVFYLACAHMIACIKDNG